MQSAAAHKLAGEPKSIYRYRFTTSNKLNRATQRSGSVEHRNSYCFFKYVLVEIEVCVRDPTRREQSFVPA